jgi:hypothetical protein
LVLATVATSIINNAIGIFIIAELWHPGEPELSAWQLASSRRNRIPEPSDSRVGFAALASANR